MTTTHTPLDALGPESADSRLVPVDDRQQSRLRRMNVIAGIVHLASGTLMVALGNGFRLDISSFSMDGPPGTALSAGTVHRVFGVRLAWATAAFAFLSAIFHLVVATLGRRRYVDELRHGRNRFRWVEYSISATLMMVLIALITGITDLAALIAIVFASVAMILFGWLMELVNPPGRTRTWWTPFWFGCVAGAGPWVALVTYLVVNVSRPGAGRPPGFVYGIIVTLFLLFNCFAVNQWLQYRGKGRWHDYLFGERTYIVLSLVAKLVLAWQIFANTLV